MKVAIIHDQLAEFGGAERVLVELKNAYPQAHVYTSFVDKKRLGADYEHFKDWQIVQSFAAYIPFFKKLYSPLRFVLPLIWSSFDLSQYDVVIASSSWGMCKGVARRKYSGHRPKFFCYLHTPPRYLWGYDESSLKKYFIVRVYALIVNHFLRIYDVQSSQCVDEFIFNSQEIRARSLKFYGRDGVVVNPPIKPSQQQTQNTGARDYYLTISRLAPTKHIDLIINASNKMGFKLMVCGSGNQEGYLRQISGPTVTLMGQVQDSEFASIYGGAKAFIFASALEDFGMAPVEAMSYGVPVIAYASGGVLETVPHGVRGLTYKELTVESLSSAIAEFEALPQSKIDEMTQNAKQYAADLTPEKFISRIKAAIESKL